MPDDPNNNQGARFEEMLSEMYTSTPEPEDTEEPQQHDNTDES